MKVLLTLLVTFLSYFTYSQQGQDPMRWITPDGIFDIVVDKNGDAFDLVDLRTNSSKPIGASNTVQSVPSQSCNTGYFTLFFAPGSYFASSAAAQSVACEVFLTLSTLINTSLPNNIKINIYCGDVAGGGAGFASPYYVYPSYPTNPNQGYGLSQVEKALIMGIDPFANLPISVFPGSNNFYYGYLFVSPSLTWNTSMNTLSISASQHDLFTVVMHEAIHLLGFSSLINHNGNSRLLTQNGNNLYATYDKFLVDHSLNPILTSTTAGTCPNSNVVFNSGLSTTVIATSASTSCGSNSTDCSTGAKFAGSTYTTTVFTPSCYTAGSSLSHFEDICDYGAFTTTCTPATSPGFNDLYFIMSNSISPGHCYVKRFPREEEYKVLCDIGYPLTGTLTSNAVLQGTSTIVTYSTGSCSPTMNIVGMNDGYSGGVYTLTTTTGSAVINFTTLLSNDLPANSLTVSCVELIYNNATFTTSATDMTVSAGIGTGLVLLKYLPKNSANQFGNITYVFVYFIPNGCNPSNSCNMLQNGGFENLAAANPPCGGIGGAPPTVTISCWKPYLLLPVLFASGCTSGAGFFNLGNSTLYTDVPVGSFNGSPTNTNAIGLGYFVSGANTTVESMQNQLSSPLVPGQSYSVSFWIMNHSANPAPTTNTYLNTNNSPVVISLASSPAFPVTPTLNFPSGLNELKEFTVNASNNWALVTGTFAFSSTLTNHSAFFIGLHASKTASIATTGTSAVLYCFIDDVNLVPIGSPTFAVPNQTICVGQSYTNLAQYASAITGSFSGTGITSAFNGTDTEYHFNASGTLSPGNYPVAFNYTSGCFGTVWQNIVIQNTIGLTTSGSVTFCANAPNSLTVTASISPTVPGLSFTWLPGNLTGSAQVVNPQVNTIYTVNASSSGYCIGTGTVSVDVYTACCSPTVTASLYTHSLSMLPANMSGSNMLNLSMGVPTGSTTTISGELLFIPDIKITVYNSGHLILDGAHLFACGINMWDGIEVLPGGKVTFTNTSFANLIEDAKTAVDITGHSTTTVNPVLTSNGTTFNKNFIDINIATYQNSVTPNPVSIKNSVFTCRKLDFTSTQWPQVGASSTATGSTADLRTAINPTTGLFPPYLAQNGMTITTLKSPYSNQSSKFAIKLSDVGYTSGNNFYGIQIGDASSANDFNLFDAHEIFIYGTNSNIKSYNNVFQNTKYSIMTLPGFVAKGAVSAILSNITNNLNANLDLTVSNFNTGNRFWDCHRAIQGSNVYRFNIEKGIFRSTQSTSLVGVINPGNMGISLKTNRMQYYIKYNEFTNIANCINIPIAAGNFTSLATGSVQYGVYAANISVLLNTLSAGTSTTQYVNNAVNISAVNQIPWTIAPDYTASTANRIGIRVENNDLENVFRGIYIQNITNFQTDVLENEISLRNDATFNLNQHGIDLSENFSGGNRWAQYVVADNNLVGVGASTSNTVTSLIFCRGNKGLASPSVVCNDVSDSYQGFEFSGINTPSTNITGTRWFGNNMEDLIKGMALTYTGVIGQQGVANNGMGNFWNGTWPGAGATHGIWTYSSVAVNSSLIVTSTTTPAFPPNLDGDPTSSSYQSGGISTTTINAAYSCTDPSAIIISGGNNIDYASDEHEYIVKTGLYRFLHFNDSVRESASEFESFYENLSGTSVDNFILVENYLLEGNYSTARSTLNSITPENQVETNYKIFYNIYANYEENLANAEEFSADDSTDLANLCFICPVANGGCIIQARALYNVIYNQCNEFPDCEESSGERRRVLVNNSDDVPTKISIHPNPTSGEVTIQCSSGIRSIAISDLTGRMLFQNSSKDCPQKYTFDSSVSNGVYLISIVNCRNEISSRKLIVTE